MRGNASVIVYKSQYAGTNKATAGDVYVTKNFKTAWFKDPDGNILAIMGS